MDAPARICDRRTWLAAILAVTVAAALCLLLPHLRDEVWYDEAYTLEHFATGSLKDAFTRYDMPNNHALFSGLLSLWRRVASDDAGLRMLPLLFFAGSLPLVIIAGARLGGPLCGAVAGMIFATSHVTVNFALQLRGYGPSWLPVAAGLLALPLFLGTGRAAWGWVYAAAGAVAVGMVPTNLAVFAVLGVWAALVVVLSGRWRTRKELVRLALALAAPFLGIIFYAGVFRRLIGHAKRPWTSDTLPDVFRQWFGATVADFWWLLPLALLGVVGLLRRLRRGGRADFASPAGLLLLAASCVVIPPALYAALPQMPFSRTLVPLLPVWCVVLGALAAAGLSQVFTRPSTLSYAAIGLVLVAAAFGIVREADNASYVSRNPDGSRPQNLYDQYYHHAFSPAAALDVVHCIAAKHPCIALTDNSDLWALRHAAATRYPDRAGGLGAPLGYYQNPANKPLVRAALPERWLLLLTCNRQRAEDMLRDYELPDAHSLQLVESTGFFKVYLYAPRPPSSAPSQGPLDPPANP